MYKNVKKKMHFMLHLLIHLTVQPRGEPEGTHEGVPNDTLTNLHKTGDAFEVALKDTLEVALGLYLWLHLFMKSLINKFVQNGSFNGGPDAH